MDNTLKIAADEFSRRSMLRTLAVTAGGAAMLGTAMGGTRVAEAQTKVAQKAVSYQDKPKGDQRCDNCTQFQPPSACKVVAGTIVPGGWCTIYVKKPA